MLLVVVAPDAELASQVGRRDVAARGAEFCCRDRRSVATVNKGADTGGAIDASFPLGHTISVVPIDLLAELSNDHEATAGVEDDGPIIVDPAGFAVEHAGLSSGRGR